MKNVYRQSQEALNELQPHIREGLEQIQYLDKGCLQLQLNLQQLRQAYIEQLKGQYSNDQQYERIQLGEIGKLQEELRELAEKKVKIAQEIQLSVTQCTKKIQKQILHKMQDSSYPNFNIEQLIRAHHLQQPKKHKPKHKSLNPQIKNIIQNYYHEKDNQSEYTLLQPKYCICPNYELLQLSGQMIECENPKCQIGWYHFQCVNILPQSVPDHWFCQLCHQSVDTPQKVTFKHEEQQIQLQIKPQTKQQNAQPVKRKRGRPRKVQVVQQ